jgi:hypothetical protein
MSASVKEGLRKIVETFLDEEGYRKKKTTIMDSALQKLRMKGNILHKKVNNEVFGTKKFEDFKAENAALSRYAGNYARGRTMKTSDFF